MSLALSIALRYFFSKKDHNVINIISMICVGGIMAATVALVCTLSVYNGFQSLITDFYNTFDTDLRINPVQGKTFNEDSISIDKIKSLPYVEVATTVLEDGVLLRHKEKQVSITIKGVSGDYTRLTGVDSIMMAGKFILRDDNGDFAVVGGATLSDLEAGIYTEPVLFYAPRHGAKVNIANPEKSFNEIPAYISGVYATNQRDIDSKFAFVSTEFARTLLGYEGSEVSAIEIRLKPNASTEVAKKEISAILGNDFKVLDKREQHEDVYKMLKIEKWITFLILFFILVIAIINVAGSLTMLIIEKQNDIQILSSLGATDTLLRQIFIFEGWLVSFFGLLAGLIIGLILCAIQQIFGILKLNGGDDSGVFLINTYPVEVQAIDILVIATSVLIVGFIVAWFPTRYIKKAYSQS